MLNIVGDIQKNNRSDVISIPSAKAITREDPVTLEFDVDHEFAMLEIAGQIQSATPGEQQDLICYVECLDAAGALIESPGTKLTQTNEGKLYFYPIGVMPKGSNQFRKLITVDRGVSRVRVALALWRNRKGMNFEATQFTMQMSNVLVVPGSTEFSDLLDLLIQRGGLDPAGRVLDIAGAMPDPDKTIGPIAAAFAQPIDCMSLPMNKKQPWLDTRRMLDGCQFTSGPSGQYTLISLYPHHLPMAALLGKLEELCDPLEAHGVIVMAVKTADLEALPVHETDDRPLADDRAAVALNAAFMERMIPLRTVAIARMAETPTDLNWVVLRKAGLERRFPGVYDLMRRKDYAAVADMLYDALLPVLLGEADVTPAPDIAPILHKAVGPLDAGGNYEAAVKCLVCAAALDPESPELRLEVAARFRTRDEFDKAEKIIDLFLQDQPNHLGGIINQALLYSQVGRGLESMEMAERYLALAGRRVTLSVRRTITTLMRNFAQECQSAGLETRLPNPLLAPDIAATYLADPKAFAQKWYQPRLNRLLHHDAVDRRQERDRALRVAGPLPRNRKLRVLITSSGAWAFVLKMIKHLNLCEDDIEYRTFDFEYLEQSIRKDHLHEVFAPVSMGLDPEAIWNRVVADQKVLGDLVEWSDMVFCEWAGFHAVWLSRFLPPEKQLVVRLHSYEAFSAWPFFLNFGGVDGVVFVADHIRRFSDIQFRFSEHCPTTTVLQNFNDPDVFSTQKEPGAERVLGMLGYSNLNKDPLFAAQLLARLRQEDPSWRLRLVGSTWNPDTLNPAELAYFRSFEQFVADNRLEEAIDYVGFTRDVGEALTHIGFIMSCSHREGTHEAIIEGMASGAVPVIRRWPMVRNLGAPETSYPGLTYVDTVEEAADVVLAAATPDDFRKASAAAADYAREQFDPEKATRAFAGFLRDIAEKRNVE